MSTDGTWQCRGHESLYGVQSVISADTGKILDYEIESRFCHSCQVHNSWDKTSEKYKKWKEGHRCSINFTGSSKAMEAHGIKLLWGRSLEKHNLRYTTFIGDGDSSSYKSVCDMMPYGPDVVIEKSDCVGHVQKRMGTALLKLQRVYCDRVVVPAPAGMSSRKGIAGKGRLTLALVDKMQTYYGLAIRRNIGDADATANAIHAILEHHRNDHHLCPVGKDSWCKFQKGDPKYRPKNLPPEVLEVMQPEFDRLANPDLLDRLRRGDTQNSNEAFHSLIWKRSPKHIFASPVALKLSVALAVIQRNVGNVGLLKVLEQMGICDNPVSERLLEKIDCIKESKLCRKKAADTKIRRKLLRASKKKKEDILVEKEGPSYVPGGFDTESGASAVSMKKQPVRKRRATKHVEDTTSSSDSDEPGCSSGVAKRKRKGTIHGAGDADPDMPSTDPDVPLICPLSDSDMSLTDSDVSVMGE